MKVLVTGASGFVGRHLIPALLREHEVVAATRRADSAPRGSVEVVVGDIDGSTEWADVVEGIDAVVHLAARVHVLKDDASDSLAAYRTVNTDGTLELARAAAAAGVARFVFMSTIKVNGEATLGHAFNRESTPAPNDPYGVSKLEAEEGLAVIGAAASIDVISLRPPVIYGAGVGGNIGRVARAVKRGVPLPLGAISNRRTMLAIDNVVTAIEAALTVEPVPRHPVVLGDLEPVSTPQLVRYLAEGMGRRARLVPVPVRALETAGAWLGKGSEIERLVQDLEIDGDWESLGVPLEALVTPGTAFQALGRALSMDSTRQ